MSITRSNMNSFCRICLTKLEYGGSKFHIHKTRNLSKWITMLTSVEMEKCDGYSQPISYPNFSCQQCYDKLEKLYDFRTMFIRSMQILNDVMQGKSQQLITNCESENEVKDDDNIVITNDKSEDLSCAQRVCKVDEEGEEALVDTLATGPNDQINVSGIITKLEVQSRSFEYDGENKTENYSDEDCKTVEFHGNVDSDTDNYEEKLQEETFKFDRRMCTKVSTNGIERKKKVFKCEKCTKRCFSQANFDAHMRMHEGLKPYPCNQCHRSYKKTSHLNAHIKDSHSVHTEEFACDVEGCDKKFRRMQSYRVHYRIKHAQDKPSPKIYVCEDCGRTFKNITTLKEHRYKHTNEEDYPYQCEHCLKRFVSQRTYREHLMRHAGIKNFVCTYCGMKKTTKSELRIHINYHTKEKQWACPLCPSVFNSSANLGLHDRVVHKGIRRYVCRFCEQSFGKAETLKHHEMRHTGEKPHECDICGKRFIQVVALRAHMKTHKNLKEENDAIATSTKENTVSIPAIISLPLS